MYRLTDAFPYLIARVGVRMAELFAKRLESFGVTLPMYRVMAALWQRGGQRLGDLSEMTSVEISTLSRLVGVMQRRGLLSRRRPRFECANCRNKPNQVGMRPGRTAHPARTAA